MQGRFFKGCYHTKFPTYIQLHARAISLMLIMSSQLCDCVRIQFPSLYFGKWKSPPIKFYILCWFMYVYLHTDTKFLLIFIIFFIMNCVYDKFLLILLDEVMNLFSYYFFWCWTEIMKENTEFAWLFRNIRVVVSGYIELKFWYGIYIGTTKKIWICVYVRPMIPAINSF